MAIDKGWMDKAGHKIKEILVSSANILEVCCSREKYSFCLICFQEAIVKIMKMRKNITNAQLQTELVEILKNMFLPTKKMIKEQTEWLIEHKYMRRDEENVNTFIYMA